MNLKTTNTNTKNFFQKTFILLAILAFTSFGFKAKAQSYTVTVNNTLTSTCTWTILLLDGSNNVLETMTSTLGSTTYSLYCHSNLTSIAISDNSGNCQGYTFGSGGSFPYTAVIPQCSFPKVSCSTSIDCQGAAAIASCTATPPVGSTVVTININ